MTDYIRQRRLLSIEGLADAAARRPWRVVALWTFGVVLAIVAIATLLGGSLTSEQRLTNDPESYRALRLFEQRFPQRDDADEIVVVRSERYDVDHPRFRAFVRGLAARGRATGAIAGARSYHASGDRSLVSRDRHATILPIVMGSSPDVGIERVIDVVEDADRDPAFEVSIVGEWTVDRDFLKLSQNDLKEGEAFFGGPASLVVLVLVFGALVAAGVPLLLALVSIVVALGISALIAQLFEVSVFLINMLTAVGLALGIDYALFVLSRYREERAAGRGKLEAISATAATSSRAVFFSGTAFAIALLGLLLVPDNIMRSLALGAIVVGIVSVLAALTLLPALLSLLGDRVNALRVPLLGRVVVSGEREAGLWSRVARAVMRAPLLSLVLGVAILLAAAYPVLDLRTGFAAVSTFPEGYASKEGLDALERDFRGGRADPVRIVVRGDVSSEIRNGIARLTARLRGDEAFGTPSVQTSPAGDVAVITTALRGSSTDPEPVRAVRELRSQHVPAAFAGTDAEVLVGGQTAENVDYFDTMEFWLPIVVAFVLGLSFVLLTIAFRSIVVALKAIVLNLLSVGAAYGLLVLVFEKGVGAELLGFRQVDSVVAWVPLFLFCVLFGLSMDYHVFLLSRIRERFVETGDNAEAVAHGVGTTARLITGAALIIIVVFVGFSTGDLVMFQQMGFGVAVALFIDATLVRTVLVPAAMQLLGERNWYLPRWLEWLPRLQVEGTPRSDPTPP